jgi:hypothetical protein
MKKERPGAFEKQMETDYCGEKRIPPLIILFVSQPSHCPIDGWSYVTLKIVSESHFLKLSLS